MPTLHLAQDPAADRLLSRHPLALLIGMVLDQQIPLEWAFTGPYVLQRRLGVRTLTAGQLAGMEPEALAAVFAERPALHRYPSSMAARVQALCAKIVADYGGKAERIWTGAATGAELLRRLEALPGFGRQKARIFVALLGKQYGVQPPGWREAAGEMGEEGSRRSVADITGPESLLEVRTYKQRLKRAAQAEAQAKAPSPRV